VRGDAQNRALASGLGRYLVMARFEVSAARELYDQLWKISVHPRTQVPRHRRRLVKPPTSGRQEQGETIILDRRSDWFVLVGPNGKSLKQDIELREHNDSFES
jgi:hypothetical protein